MITRYDSSTVSAITKDPITGYIHARNVPIARAGVFKYLKPDGTVRHEHGIQRIRCHFKRIAVESGRFAVRTAFRFAMTEIWTEINRCHRVGIPFQIEFGTKTGTVTETMTGTVAERADAIGI